MTVQYSWGLPYWSGLASPIASTSQLYNAWANSNNSNPSTNPLNQIAQETAKAKALADASSADILGSDSSSSYNPNYQSELTPSENEITFTEGFGLPGLVSSGLGAATSIGLNYTGIPGAVAGTLGSVVGQKAGKGINAESLANMAFGKIAGAISPPLGMAYGLASMLGLNAAQGFGEMAGMYPDLTPGFEGGFWGHQGIGSGIDSGTFGGYNYGGETPGSIGVGAENAGADTLGSGLNANSFGQGLQGALSNNFQSSLGEIQGGTPSESQSQDNGGWSGDSGYSGSDDSDGSSGSNWCEGGYVSLGPLSRAR